jgi:hypothetical protein
MKNLFLFLMIILPTVSVAQTVSNLSVSPGTPSTVTFDVEWNKADLDLKTLWLDSMWVFVDYNKNGKMTRMLISGGTLTAHSGTGEFIPENTMGAWVYGDARSAGSFSATVQLLTAAADLYGACAYASSYPPVGQYVSSTEITFAGTPGYKITLSTDGGVETIETGSTLLLPCGYCLSSFTDATGAPGIIKGLAPTGLSSNITMFCNSEFTDAILTASGGSAGSGTVYEWGTGNIVGNNPLGTTAGNTYAVSPSAPTTYWVRLRGAGACSATVSEGVTTAIWVYTEPAPVGYFASFISKFSNLPKITNHVFINKLNE